MLDAVEKMLDAVEEVHKTIALMAENWFLSEPVYYAVYCTQELQENARMACAVRCGKGRLEYNPLVLAHKNYRETELLFRTEMIRLLMRHPYERRPERASDEVIAIGSDITLGDNYCFIRGKEKLPVQTPEAYHLPLGMPYEWYVAQLSQNSPSSQPSPPNGRGGEMADKAALWEEDELQRERITDLLDRTTDWGSIPAELQERIRIASRPKVNHQHILQGFRAAVLSDACTLTRMRPNRRTNYQQMGRRRTPQTRLLVAIDVSGSVSTDLTARFFAILNRLFVTGSAQIDLLTFDAEIQSQEPYRRTRHEVLITGRGGTNYQPVLDYAAGHREYNGLLILTDGDAPVPQWFASHRMPILWGLIHPAQYERFAPQLRATGRVTLIQ